MAIESQEEEAKSEHFSDMSIDEHYESDLEFMPETDLEIEFPKVT